MKIGLLRLPTQTAVVAFDDSERVRPVAVADDHPGHDPLRTLLNMSPDPAAWEQVADDVALDAGTLLAPVTAPSKVVAIGLNYLDHAREAGLAVPETPICFVKTNNAIIGPTDTIRWRTSASTEVDYEVELAVVIGRRARDVGRSEALDYVLGYTVANDVSARDAQFRDGQWSRAKSFDTFLPLGPWIITADEVPDPQALGLKCRVGGELLQDGNTGEMVFSVAEIISYLSQTMTLEPGDIICTGTPAGVGMSKSPPRYLRDGDVVECEIERIGVLLNPVSTQA